MDKDFEICGVQCKLDRNISVSIVCCYRSSDANLNIFINNLCNVLDYVFQLGKPVIIGGDFNLDPVRDLQKYKPIRDILFNYNLLNIVTVPLCGIYILDHINVNFYSKSLVTDNLISDHRSVFCSLQHYVQRKNTTMIYKRIYTKNNIILFYENLEQTN